MIFHFRPEINDFYLFLFQFLIKFANFVSLPKVNNEKGLATPSSILAGRILWTEEPGGLQSMGMQSIGHD